MKHLNAGRFVWVFVPLSAVVFVAEAWWTGVSRSDSWGLVKLIPEVVAIDTAFALAFGQWMWRWRIFRPLVPFPDLNGTWIGTLQTTWEDPKTGKRPGPIPVMLLIRQTFIDIHCDMRTEEMASDSYSSNFVRNGDRTRKLVYSYTSEPKATVAHRSAPHDGTIKLDILDGPPRELRGPYWSLRKTTGEVTLRFHSLKYLERLPRKLGPHPVSESEKTASP